MNRIGLWAVLKSLVRLQRTFERIATALERLADVYAPPGLTVDPPPEPLVVADPRTSDAHVDFKRAYEVELSLTKQLGREPSPDEILKVMAEDLLDADDAPEDLRARKGLAP